MIAYEHVVAATFVRRPNRFIAHVMLEGREVVAHVKNTGRCKELLVPNARVYLSVAPPQSVRKTAYDLIAVEKVLPSGQKILINMDANLPNALVEAYLSLQVGKDPHIILRREVVHGDSRFDLCLTDTRNGHKTFIEVKGVTLEHNGVASFPDAPTQRGIKHLRGLADCVKEGHGAWVFFVIQMKGVHRFRPNDITHPAFGDALRYAAEQGVIIKCMDCQVTPEEVSIHGDVPVDLTYATDIPS